MLVVLESNREAWCSAAPCLPQHPRNIADKQQVARHIRQNAGGNGQHHLYGCFGLEQSSSTKEDTSRTDVFAPPHVPLILTEFAVPHRYRKDDPLRPHRRGRTVEWLSGHLV